MFNFLTWLKPAEPLLLKVWEAVLSLFEKHPIRIALAGVLLLSALLTGNEYIRRTRQYQDIVSTTVRAETEDTPERFKVLEAFIMSTIDPQLSERIQKAIISSDFSDRLAKLDRALAGRQTVNESKAAPDVDDPAAHTYLSIPDYVSNVDTLPSHSAILTDDADDGYLFFPLKLLRTKWESNYGAIFAESKKVTPSPSPTLAQAVKPDQAIVDDIAMSRKLLPLMKQFTQIALFRDDDQLKRLAAEVRPVQIYYITKNGINRIINNSPPDEQKIVYRNMFRSTTFFPSRPYFVEAFRRIKPGHLAGVAGPAGEAFYVSRPYLDIAGFGVVVTMARPVSYANHSDAAICFDLRVRLDNDVSFQLKQRLASFGSQPQEVKCDVGFGAKIDCPPSPGPDVGFPLKKTLEDQLNRAMVAGDLSTVVGDISILDDQAKESEETRASAFDVLTYPVELIFGYHTRPITFAIPISAPSVAPNKSGLVAQFMIASLNLERFQQITSLVGFVSVSLLGFSFCVVLFSWQGEMRTRQSYEEAFKTVDGVLYGAPTPYVRLDARDAVVDCNTAFCGLLGMPADEQSVKSLTGKTFESLLAQRSKATYHDVQERRKKREEVPPYTLYFMRKDGTEIEARVTSGAMPGQSGHELPQTFGIAIASAEVSV